MDKMRKVMLLFDTSGAASRRTIRGIAQYSNLHGPWFFFREPPFYIASSRGLRKISGKLLRPDGRKVDGVIAHLPYTTDSRQYIPKGIPAVISPYVTEVFPNFYNFITNDKEIGRLAAEYFLHRQFHFFAYCGYPDIWWSKQRSEGFGNEITGAGFEVHNYRGSEGSSEAKSPKDERTLLADWLNSLPRPLALMACNDDRAQDALEACKIAGLSVPYEVAVLGVDNDDLICGLTTPLLSSVAINHERAGYEAAELLDDLMAGKKPRKNVVIAQPTHIVTRQSTDIFAIDDAEITKALRFICEHCREDIHVDDVVEAVTLSRRVLEQRFRKILGHTILGEIRRVRVGQIARLLVETNMSVYQIAETLGFKGIEHIARYFRREKATSLIEYRKCYGRK